MTGRPLPPVPEDLTREQRRALWEWVGQRYPAYRSTRRLRELIDETLDYHRAIGNRNRYVDWLAVVRNRVRQVAAREGLEAERRAVRAEPEPIGAQLKLLIGGRGE